MDGRALPKNVSGTEKGARDPRYYGYSVGHWEGDNTLVIETSGLDDRTWLDLRGYPHTVDAHVEERFTTPAQANTSTEPVQNATAPTNELKPAPGLPIDEVHRSVSNDPDLELSRPAIGGDGTASDPAGSGVADNSLPREIHAKPISPQRHAANIRDAQLSTGPRTAAGKKKSAMNAYKQGLYARHLFPTADQWGG